MGPTRNKVSLAQKKEILNELDDGQDPKTIRLKYHIAPRTLRRIRQERDSILLNYDKIQSVNGDPAKVLKIRSPSFGLVDDAVYTWVLQQRHLGVHVTSQMVRGIALHFNEQFGGNQDFQASNGWLHGFQRRHGVCWKNEWESSVADQASEDDFVSTLQEIIDESTPLDNVYNAIEKGLYWNMFPNNTIAASKDHSSKIEKLTVLICCNASGSHQLKGLVVGKSRTPCCIENTKSLPESVRYTSRSNACMDPKLFLKWYSLSFIPAVKEKQEREGMNGKVILLLDDAPAYPALQQLNDVNPNFEVRFLPPHMTSLGLPMEGAMDLTKRAYRRLLLQHHLFVNTEEEFLMLYKSLNVLQACTWFGSAWASVSQKTLCNLWNNFLRDGGEGQNSTSDSVSIEIELIGRIPGCERVNRQDVKEWLDCDKHVAGYQVLSNEEIVSSLQDVQDNEIDDSEDGEGHNRYGQARAVAAVDSAIHWAKSVSSGGGAVSALLHARRAIEKLDL